MRRMSCSMTIDSVRAKDKLATRRHVDTWKTLQPGDHLLLIEKGMGLPKGAKQVILAEVEVVDVRVEKLSEVTPEEVRLEGLYQVALDDEGWDVSLVGEDQWVTEWFVNFWCNGHGYRGLTLDEQLDVECRRIEWRYPNALGSFGEPA